MRFIFSLNFYLSLAILCLIGIDLFLVFSPQETPPLLSPTQQPTTLPANPFSYDKATYKTIGAGLFSLQWDAPQLELPDLCHAFICYGKNKRPDISPEKALYHLGIQGNTPTIATALYKKNYLTVTNTVRKSHFTTQEPIFAQEMRWQECPSPSTPYSFSPQNHPTNLWIELHPHSDKTLEVRLFMFDEKENTLLHLPHERSLFHIPIQEEKKASFTGWDLGGLPVDSTILIRQKAHWIGKDVFLENHGGEEFSHCLGKERIDFLEEDSLYSCFVEAQDFLIWKEGKWHVATPEEDTTAFPLLVIKKMDEKSMSLELWDLKGKNKTPLNLLRSKDTFVFPDLSSEFKFAGIKTLNQFIVECSNQKRLILKPDDWLLLSDKGWEILSSPEEIDAYVHQQKCGSLFILEKLKRQEGQQVLVGHLFNASRTALKEIEIPLSSYSENFFYKDFEIMEDF